ncbi:2-vinyl bacteriochlorophyllide hydratase [Sandarakinorhabdus cyanobacteriorum]|uniref:2-vinyl bacteriochlorophyllide hydratase n=1 Tax=Sandarakinorhabdus cyanobacteriorum TaxID=1981098 RepID=A0A255YN39_9SPHN|nr:2-vinyl bacteriochlorophyllide hydratase [Sandarakinorhabdus cyanobacteriorum]OYQ30672.1 2-vinyl bacteriochlorophyllide hydratase [Sandarakinorhabdus cyanobacteriorum]
MVSATGERPLYTPEERVRRDSTKWTLVQGLLAPVQFLIFGVSLYLVIDYLNTGNNYEWAIWSVVIKTIALYTIMVTGAIWEKVVFGQYLFHESFFWEDVFSMLVIILHTLYLVGLFTGIADDGVLFGTALAAYVAYVINAAQFVWKLRQARLSSQPAAQAVHAADSDVMAGAHPVAQAA